MSPRNKVIVFLADQAGVTAWVGEFANGFTAIGTAPAVSRHPSADVPSTSDISQTVTAELVRATEIIATKHRRAYLEIVLSGSVAPGLSVGLGDQVMPVTIRQQYASQRLCDTFGVASADWDVQVDSTRARGSVLTFALPKGLAASWEEIFKLLQPRTVSIVPVFVWAWQRFAGRLKNGLLIVASETEITSGIIREGYPSTLSVEPRSGGRSENWTAIGERHYLMHGSSSPEDSIYLVALPNFFTLGLAPPHRSILGIDALPLPSPSPAVETMKLANV